MILFSTRKLPVAFGALLRFLKIGSGSRGCWRMSAFFLGLTGIAQAGGIGNLVYRDQNADRVFNAGDARVASVPLQLFQAGKEPGIDQPVAITQTNGVGQYLFSGLPDGDYYVFIPGVAFTSGGSLINTRSVPGTPGGTDADDGEGENGIDSASPTSMGVRSGVVMLREGMAPVSSQTETGADSDSDDAADSNTDLTIDFGFQGFTTRIGDFVWRDLNRNGLQDAGERGEPAVQVQLFTADDNFVAAAVTAVDGYYSFTNLRPGSYYVRFPTSVFPLQLTIAEQDPADVRDSDAALATGRTPVYTLGNLEHQTKVDAGYVVDRPDIGDYIFNDLNRDGVQDPGEGGISGVEVGLYTAAGAVVATTASGDGGFYVFPEVEPGQYYLNFPVMAGALILTSANNGLDDVNDSDAHPVTGNTEVFTVKAGLDDFTWDAGYHLPPIMIRGTTWRDLNRNGIRETGEPLLAGVALSLLDGDTDEVILTTATDSVGAYTFPNLNSQPWKIEFAPLAGTDQRYQLTLQDVGGDDSLDSDAAPNNGRTLRVVPVDRQAVVLDAGYREVRLGIGNGVFIDANGSGTFNAGEGVGGVTVQLFSAGSNPLTDVPLRSATTGTTGIYSIPDLNPGQYFAWIPPAQFAPGAPLAGYISLPGNGADDGVDDNAGENGNDAAHPASAGIRSNDIMLTTGAEPRSGVTETGRSNSLDGIEDDANVDLTVDFGFQSGMTLGNLVFSDADNNGRYTNGEGVAGVKVELHAAASQPGVDVPLGSVFTDPGGFYAFAGVMPGNYVVHLSASNFLQGQPLARHTSLTGHGTSANTDDGLDENGIDAANPSITGISSPPVLLFAGNAPTAANGETGAGSGTDDGNDANGDLTVDFGFVPGLPTSYAAWQLRFLPSGSNSPSQDADRDGQPNAYEYVYHLSPSGSTGAESPLGLRADPATGLISATLIYNPGAADAPPLLTWRADLRDGTGIWQTMTSPVPTDVILPDGRRQRTWSDLEAVPALAGGTGFVRATSSMDTNGDSMSDFTFHTPVLGWLDRLHHEGTATAATAFLRPALFRGTVDSASGPALTLTVSTGAGNLASIFPPGVACYAEITGGSWEGHRFEIDETATSGAMLRLLAASPLHTRSVPDLTGVPLVVRPHWTLATLFPPAQFKADTDSTRADQVLTYPRPSFATHWLLDLGANDRWVRADDSSLSDAGHLPIPPGEGVFVNRRDPALTVLDMGEVRPHAMARLLNAGYTLQASGWPVPGTPVSCGLLASDGFTGNTNPAQADGLQIWGADTHGGAGAFRSYFLLRAAVPYRYWTEKSDANLQDRNNEILLMPSRAVFLQLRAGIPDSRQPRPWTP